MAKIRFKEQNCTACAACAMACMDENDIDPAAVRPYRTVTTEEALVEGVPVFRFRSVSCLHCDDAPCMAACPMGCFYREADLELICYHNDRCVGCRACERACPQGAVSFGRDGRMEKCDGCAGRQRQGLLPACVRVCPFGALTVE